MSNVTKQATGPRIGFFGLLTLIFITLKLCNIITWSWVWVLAPLWLPFAVAIGILVIIGCFVGFGALILALTNR